MDHAETERAFVNALLNSDMPVPTGVTTSRGRADAKRFAVYRNNVAVGLSRALAGRFPIVEKLVGAEFFAGMTRAFIAASKPASPIITAYGDDLPDFIATFAPAASVPYLADVARLEAAWTRAYHAADAEPLAIATLAALDGAALTSAKLVPHPAAALVRSTYPAGSIWQTHQADPGGSKNIGGGECVLVARAAFDVSVHILPEQDAIFAISLFAGQTIGAAAETASSACPEFDFGAALIGLVSLGAFTGIAIVDGASSHG